MPSLLFDSFAQVGFGDMVPKKSFLGYGESLFGKFQMLVCVTYCALGLALLAMCMSLIQVHGGFTALQFLQKTEEEINRGNYNTK